MNLTKEIIENIRKDYPNQKNALIALKNAIKHGFILQII